MEKEHLEILLEDIKDKVEPILEGYDTLHSKIDRVEENLEEKIEFLGTKIDAVANDLAAHRADTESHPKGNPMLGMGRADVNFYNALVGIL